MSVGPDEEGATPRFVVVRALKVVGVGVVIVLALVAILTALRTELPRNPGVMSDALGPDPGEPVATYLERARASLSGSATDSGVSSGTGNSGDSSDSGAGTDGDASGVGGSRWALVTAVAPWSVGQADAMVAGVARVSRVYLQVPVPGVAMPVADVTLAEPTAGETSRESVFTRAVRQVADRARAVSSQADSVQPDSAQPDRATTGAATKDSARGDGEDRGGAAAALTGARLQAGEAAIIGLVVRGTPEELRAVASRPGVRAVEALPGDSVWGRFAVRPLQPQQVEAADPLADDAPVPPA